MTSYKDLCINQKINFKTLLIKCGFESITKTVNTKYCPIHPVNPIFDKVKVKNNINL